MDGLFDLAHTGIMAALGRVLSRMDGDVYRGADDEAEEGLKMAIRKSVAREDKQLSPHFRLVEFRCRGSECAGLFPEYISPALVILLEKLRSRFNAPLRIQSGFRCKAHNKEVGGSANSRHMHGDGADIRIHGIQPSMVANAAEELVGDTGGVGRYARRFTHVDVRGSKARWAA